jgi:hypothetical protein
MICNKIFFSVPYLPSASLSLPSDDPTVAPVLLCACAAGHSLPKGDRERNRVEQVRSVGREIEWNRSDRWGGK